MHTHGHIPIKLFQSAPDCVFVCRRVYVCSRVKLLFLGGLLDVFSQLWLSIAFIQNASDLISTPIIIYMPEILPILPGDREHEHEEKNLIDGIEADKE